VVKLPEIEIVKPKPWDLAAFGVLALSGVLAAANLALSVGRSGPGSISGGTTLIFIAIQMLVCCLAFLVVGKTAKVGTIWGNLLATAAGVAGMSGVLLASTLWALA
jgi:hypothetical protein